MTTCPICGNVEPPHWSDEIELHEYVRERARNYRFPPIIVHPTYWHAAEAWNKNINMMISFEEWQKKDLLS